MGFSNLLKEKTSNIYNKSKNIASNAVNITIESSRKYCAMKKKMNLFIGLIFIIIILFCLYFFIKAAYTKVPQNDPNKEQEDSTTKILSGFFGFFSLIIVGGCYYNYLLLQTDLGCMQAVIKNTTSMAKFIAKR